MCESCWVPNPSSAPQSPPSRGGLPRRAWLLATVAAASAPVLAQVDVGKPSEMRKLVPAETLENSARQEYVKVLADARANGRLAAASDPQLRRLHRIANRLIPFANQWNRDITRWRWEVNLINSPEINAWCMPGGKIAFYSGILDKLRLTDDEVAMIMGHEMAHALREHARERLAKTQATGLGLSLAAQLLGWGQIGDVAANLGTQLLTLKYSRDDETEADLVGLEIAARAGYNPQASVSLWQKMMAVKGAQGSASFLSTHPAGPERIQQLQANLPKVQGLYERAPKG
ncbi:MAG: M48 family metallopeptidase [Burkholderiaceae bacterium]|nr:M48 family metallopeptidase [Burkholderiaceae bacterium]